MKIYLDTANIAQIEQAIHWGLCDGATTNPSLVAKEKAAYKDHIAKVAALVPGPVSAHFLQLLLEMSDAVVDLPPVHLELGFTRPAHADAPADPTRSTTGLAG